MKKIITLVFILFCLNSSGQINYFFWAHSGGTLYSSAAINAYYTKNDCSSGYHGTQVLVNFSAGAYTSYVSQIVADNLATAAAQTYANANGSCEADFWNTDQYCSASRDNCPSGYYSPETYNGSVGANSFSSQISQADANAQAQAQCQYDTQIYANANGTCVVEVTYYSAAADVWIFANDGHCYNHSCQPGYSGCAYYHMVVNYGAFTSTISEADANAQRDAWGQAQANAAECNCCPDIG